MRKNQKGFAPLESILFLVIIAMVVFMGWYVWHSTRITNKNLDQTLKTESSSSTIAKSNGQTQTNYFTIKEWGLRAPYKGKLHLQYIYFNDPESGEGISITSQELVSYGGDCASAVHYGIHKLTASDQPPSYDNNYQTVKDAYEKDPKSGIKLVGGYYYYGVGPQMYCGSTTDPNGNAENAAQADMENAAVSILEGLQPIPK